MLDKSAHVEGELQRWPPKEEMAKLLEEAGLAVEVGRYSVRVKDCSHFVFQEYGADICPPSIDADAPSVEEMIRDATLVSSALALAGWRHRFEIYDSEEGLAAYLHHQWPQP